MDCFDRLTTTPFDECTTLDELFARAVRLYGPHDCLGTRQLLAEEDEVQKSGKVFKKVTYLLIYLNFKASLKNIIK